MTCSLAPLKPALSHSTHLPITTPMQALFRPVSMAAPDLTLICEIMLMAEGFQEAKTLARKFITLYK